MPRINSTWRKQGTPSLNNEMRYEAFVNEYLRCWNATESVRRLGYEGNHPDSVGVTLMKNPKVRAMLKARLDQMRMGADECLARLADIARGTMADFLLIGNDGEITIDIDGAAKAGKLHLVQSFQQTKKGPEIKLYNALEALDKIAKTHALFTENLNVTAKDKLEEWLEIES